MSDPETFERLEFTVNGIPVPQGSKRAFNVGKRAVVVDTNKVTLKPWRAHVRQAAETALDGRTGFTEATFLLVDFYLPRPKTVLRIRPTVAPDLDKLVRAIGDALTDSGVLKDDSLVVSLKANKYYADDKPGVRIVVGELA